MIDCVFENVLTALVNEEQMILCATFLKPSNTKITAGVFVGTLKSFNGTAKWIYSIFVFFMSMGR